MKLKQIMEHFRLRERGEVMIEGMVVMVMTMYILVWILGLGFLYYQRYTTTIITNDAAAKIASTYSNPTSDIIMGYVTPEELSARDLYRNFTSSGLLRSLPEINQDRVVCYVQYALDRTNFFNVVKDVDVDMRLVRDSLLRKHVEVTTRCTFSTPFGIGLEMFGMGSEHTYQVTARADCTDYADYVSTVGFQKTMLHNGKLVAGSGLLDSCVKMLNSFVKVYNDATS